MLTLDWEFIFHIKDVTLSRNYGHGDTIALTARHTQVMGCARACRSRLEDGHSHVTLHTADWAFPPSVHNPIGTRLAGAHVAARHKSPARRALHAYHTIIARDGCSRRWSQSLQRLNMR